MAVENRIICSIDQGTQSTRISAYDAQLDLVCASHKTHQQYYPQSGWVEHDPEEIVTAVHSCLRDIAGQLTDKYGGSSNFKIEGVGVTNQRETVVAWNPRTGKLYYKAIVWLDTRTGPIVDRMCQRHGSADAFRDVCGLPLSTYFSALKIRWLIENVPEIASALERKECVFGTIDCWLIWNLTGKLATDVTNASRTMLMDLRTGAWSPKMLEVFEIPRDSLPDILSCAEHYGSIRCAVSAFKGVPIAGCVGDQQSACIGQGVFEEGQAKCTYGTGAFILTNTGTKVRPSANGLLTTPCYKLGPKAPTVFALEGSIAIAGAAISWMKDNLQSIRHPKETEPLLNSVRNTAGVYFVPAFSGLFAPRWRQDARGCLVGLTQHTRKAHIVRAVMESVGFQLHEILEAMLSDMGVESLALLRVDGGMSVNNAFLQLTADLCGSQIVRPANHEVTALGAAVAAGLGVGLWKDLAEVKSLLDRGCSTFKPSFDEATRQTRIRQWNRAVERSLNWVL